MVVELLLANHPQDCLSCLRNLNCELQNIAADLGIRQIRFDGEKKNHHLDNHNPALVRDQNKCILCGRCIRACSERQGVHVYSFANRGFHTVVTPAFNQGLDEAPCTYCGQCASVCPTAAIVEKDDTAKVWEALSDPAKHLRTVSEVITGKSLDCIDFHNVRGLTGIKEAVVPVGDLNVKVVVAHTLANARLLLDKIRNGEADYHFIEVMTCPGGCIGGGGQPIPVSLIHGKKDLMRFMSATNA